MDERVDGIILETAPGAYIGVARTHAVTGPSILVDHSNARH